MVRLRTRWNLKDRERSLEAIASAVGVNIWRIAGEALLSLENEGFETIDACSTLGCDRGICCLSCSHG